MIAVPPFPEEAVLAAERKELAMRILIANMGAQPSICAFSDILAERAVATADALLAELAK